MTTSQLLYGYKKGVSRIAFLCTIMPHYYRAVIGSLLLGVLLIIVSYFISWIFDTSVMTYLLIDIIAVIGIALFMGHSGISSFGAHVGFLGLAAYVSGILTIPVESKALILPNLPSWISQVELPFVGAMLFSIIFVGFVSLIFGIAIARLPQNSAAIATLGVMVIIHVLLIGMEDFTRGAQTFYSVPQYTSLPISLFIAIIVIFIARLFRESKFGLRLRALREDELAALAFGASKVRLRLVAFVVSSMISAIAGVLLAHYITAFSPKAFYFSLMLDYLVMIIIGGGSTIIGPLSGAVLVVFFKEFLRPFESGLNIGPISIGSFFGLSQVVLAIIMLLIMYKRRNGLLGLRELDERLYDWLMKHGRDNSI